MVKTLENRFIKKSDEKLAALGAFKIPPVWWSRGYEYAWAQKYVKSNDIIMDAGCGIEHPFKWWAADNCKMVYAVDLDGRIHEFPSQEKIKWYCCTIEDFPGPAFEGKDKKAFFKFDKIFCLSVLEHIKNPADTIKAFANLLRKGKKLILTIDYPLLHPSILLSIVDEYFEIGECDYNESPDDIVGPGGLRVYTAVLTRK